MAVVGGGTHALWSDGTSYSGGTITAGDLDLTVGEVRWEQVTDGVSAGQRGVIDMTPGVEPPDFRSMPGDRVLLEVPVKVTLKGDNLNGALAVNFVDSAKAAKAVAAHEMTLGWYVREPDDGQVAPATGVAGIGEALHWQDLVGDDAGSAVDLVVVVVADVLGDYQWFTPERADIPGLWATGALALRLDQVRAGAGYVNGGAP